MAPGPGASHHHLARFLSEAVDQRLNRDTFLLAEADPGLFDEAVDLAQLNLHSFDLEPHGFGVGLRGCLGLGNHLLRLYLPSLFKTKQGLDQIALGSRAGNERLR